VTSVISVRGRDRAELLADPNFVYVGRKCRGWIGSAWGNPFRVRPKDRNHDRGSVARSAQEAVARYEMWIKRHAESSPDRFNLGSLRGKTLGCWCCDWRPGEPITTPCHAIILAQLAE
jgi:hypothetical protein